MGEKFGNNQNGKRNENKNKKQMNKEPKSEPIQKMDFETSVKQKMEECVKDHKRNHPLYQDPHIAGSKIDKEKKVAAWVLFEQIDTDRCTAEGEGWLGDQFRYSVWVMKQGSEPERLYEDHAWKRMSVSQLTGSRGRDCRIHLVELTDKGPVVEITPADVEGGEHAKKKVLITFSGKIEEPDNFEDQAKNKVTSIGPRLGYDYVKECKILNDRIAVVMWGCENGSTYGYDVLYVVRRKGSSVTANAVANTMSTKNYMHIKEAKIADGKLVIKYNGNRDDMTHEEKI